MNRSKASILVYYKLDQEICLRTSWKSFIRVISPSSQSMISFKAKFQNILGIVWSDKVLVQDKCNMLSTKMHVDVSITIKAWYL
jgi:hypothetical protein